jgi:hypothetical protein
MNHIDIKSLIHENQRQPGFPKLADILIEQPGSISEVVELAISENGYPYPQYAAWLLLHVARKDRSLVEPFYNQVIDGILTTRNPSVLRSLMGVSLCFPIMDYKQGAFLNQLMELISDNDSKPGLLNYSVRKLAEFIELYPEIRREMDMILELRDEMNVNPGIMAYSKTVFKKKRKAKRPR